LKRELINTFQVTGVDSAAKLFFRDQAPANEGVDTTYKIEVFVGAVTGQPVAIKEITREKITPTAKGFYGFALADDLGVTADVLKAKAVHGKVMSFRITTTRENPRVNNGQAVVLVHSFSHSF